MNRLTTEIQKRYDIFLNEKKPYNIVKLKIPTSKFFLEYNYKFEDSKTKEIDNTGYIFYKPFGKSYGTLYMFRGKQYVQSGKKSDKFNPINLIREFIYFNSCYKNRTFIEFKILKAFIIDVGVPLLAILTIFLTITHLF
ncbi:MAG: hypothetical protein ATN32_05090 [Candidatus Epulonipiscium fishelsonii]|nr:MAG: hypothetical protein ATN32_05090 [Epulopiscium sp. AS2M-Bin002]